MEANFINKIIDVSFLVLSEKDNIGKNLLNKIINT